MNVRKIAICMLAAMILTCTSGFAQSGDRLPPINVKEYKLKNGLTVLTHQDRSTPIVAVNLWYHVGSKNEAAGRTGFAHLFEHMMFEGSGKYVDGWRAVDTLGGNVNGTTDEDRTYYYEAVPSNFLERVLYMEADRMGNLLPAVTQEKLDNQRDVVKNERRVRVDNVPYGTMSERIREVMYPVGHPYNWSVIGSMTDLSAASLEDVKSFFRQYYVPNNAILALSGDFDDKQARVWIEKYFGPIKNGPAISRPNTPMPKLDSVVRKSFDEPGIPFPRTALVWHSVPKNHPDEAPLDMLASILSSGRGSRLQSKLVYGKEMAQSVQAGNGTNEIGGLFQIFANARGNNTLAQLEEEINIEIERIKKEAPTADEMTRAVNIREASAIYGLQTVLGKGGRIADFAGYLNKPNNFQADLDRYRKVTAADIQRVANQYLIANHLVLSYVPSKAPAAPVVPEKPASTAKKVKDDKLIAQQDAMLPKAQPDPKFTLPAIQKSTLSNGLNLWVVRQSELPIVSMNLVMNAGATLESQEKAGVASMTAQMLNQGTKTRSAIEIANSLQSIGASVGAGASWDSTSLSMQTLTKHLDKALDIFADVLLNPAFPENEFSSLKGRTMNGFRNRKTNPAAISDLVYNKVLYGPQTYGRPLSGDDKTVGSIGRSDIVDFYNTNYRPNNSTLIVVGDVDASDIQARLERMLSGWKAGTASSAKSEAMRMVAKPGIYFVDRPGSSQSSIAIGQVGVERSNPDYFALQVMNSILGGGSSARIYMNLRQDKGYTYGAYSRFAYRRGAGPFSASGEIQTGSTKEAIQEFIKELEGIRGSRPVTAEELEINKQDFIRGYPAGFETVGGISNQLSNLVVYGLPDSYFNDYISRINAVTVADVNRVANRYLDPSKMAIVVVGDWKVVEPHVKELGMPVTMLDVDGNPAISQ
jgi:zinc protease